MKRRIKEYVAFILAIAMVVSGCATNIGSAESIQENKNAEYSRLVWIEEHMEYAFSDELKKEINSGFSGDLNGSFQKICNDKVIASYNTLDSINKILGFDMKEISATQEYELLLAQIFFNYDGDQALKNIFKESMIDTILRLGELLVLDKGEKIANIMDEDSEKALRSILQFLKSASTGSESYKNALDELVDFVDGHDKITFREKFLEEYKKASDGFVFSTMIDEAELLHKEFKELIMYLSIGEAYCKTSGAFGRILLAMRQNIWVNSKSSIFVPHSGNVVTEEQIQRLIGREKFESTGLANSPVVLSNLATAIENVYTSLEKYKEGNAKELADNAIEKTIIGTAEVISKNAAQASISIFSCLPVIREFKVLQTVLKVGQDMIDVFTKIDDQAYFGTMVMRLYCISYIHYLTVKEIAGTPEEWEKPILELDSKIALPEQKGLEESKFIRACYLDESIYAYKAIQSVAADYAISYYAAKLEGEKESFFPSNKKIDEYKEKIALLKKQKTKLEEISCHTCDVVQENSANYEWVVEPTVEADNIYYLADYPDAEHSINELSKQADNPNAVIQRGNELGIIDMNGKLLTEVSYREIANFGDHYMMIRSKAKYEKEYGRDWDVYWLDESGAIKADVGNGDLLLTVYYYYDGNRQRTGLSQDDLLQEAIPVQESSQYDLYDAPLVINHLFGKYALDYNCDLVTDFIYDECGSQSDGLFAVCQNGKWGYINDKGQIIIPIEYAASWKQYPIFDMKSSRSSKNVKDYCYAASDGYVVLCQSGEWELKDTTGGNIIEKGVFESICPVYDGKCWVKKDGKWGVIKIKSE